MKEKKLIFHDGFLPKGIHRISIQEFHDTFCRSENRFEFAPAAFDIYNFAKSRNAKYLFFGGSFISRSLEPNDIDCLMVFEKDEFIPSRTERLALNGVRVDIQFCSMEHRDQIDSYVYLFSHTRYGQEVGIVQIEISENSKSWEINYTPDDNTYNIIKRNYTDRSFINCYEPNGILVTIHGLYSTGRWNSIIAPIASSQGWIFAPYEYYYENDYSLLLSKNKRKEIVDDFREWIYNISQIYNTPISIIAHSFGTFIITSYIKGFEAPPVKFNSLIFTGSIISEDFDWNPYVKRSVYNILNEIAPADQVVKYMPENFFKQLLGDSLFGKSGINGFRIPCNEITQSTNIIFDHNNVIKRDIIETKWMPYLNANSYKVPGDNVT